MCEVVLPFLAESGRGDLLPPALFFPRSESRNFDCDWDRELRDMSASWGLAGLTRSGRLKFLGLWELRSRDAGDVFGRVEDLLEVRER